VADHLLNFTILGNSRTPANHRYIISRNFKHLSVEKLLQDLNQVPWHIIECFDCVNDAWYSWKSLFTEVINNHAPVRKFRAPKKPKIPWYDEDIESLKKIRDQYHRRATIGNLSEDWDCYRKTKNKVTALVRQRKKEYFTSMLEQNNGDSKSTWNTLKQLLPKCSAGGITSLEVNGTLITNFKDICNTFNSFFVDTSERLAKAIRHVRKCPMDYLEKYMPNVNSTFMFKPVTVKEVVKLLSSIPNGKATGLDNIQVRLLKASAPSIAPSLAYIFNMSLKTGMFPHEWKHARITPIFKKGTKTNPGNYRPVSVLPVVSKFMERIVHKQLYEYLSANNLLSLQQSGFRRKHSCQTSLHRLTEQLYSDLYDGNVVGLVALDLQKAFDTCDYSVLTKKLSYYGVRNVELMWFKSYLESRTQLCTIFNNYSDPEIVKCGVPQGSIIGPLLFIVYVNDLPSCFTRCHVNIYADDTAFYFADKTVNCVNEVLQNELDEVYRWLCANKLSLHVGKTQCMLICSRQKRTHITDNLDLSINKNDISQTDSIKYLGLLIDQNLRFDKYMHELMGKLNRAVGVLRRASQYVNQQTRVMLYNTLVLPHLDYCSTVWGANITSTDYKKLQRIQNCAMRVILECHHRTHIQDMLDSLHWLNVRQRFSFNILCLMWKIENGTVPEYMNLHTNSNTVHQHQTRQAVRGDKFRENCHKSSLLRTGGQLWNSLPENIRSIGTLSAFKRATIKHLRA
jgi:hypothetical protein